MPTYKKVSPTGGAFFFAQKSQRPDKLEFGGTIRRECIYAFRLGNVFIGGMLNGKMLILFVGNGFIRSAR